MGTTLPDKSLSHGHTGGGGYLFREIIQLREEPLLGLENLAPPSPEIAQVKPVLVQVLDSVTGVQGRADGYCMVKIGQRKLAGGGGV